MSDVLKLKRINTCTYFVIKIRMSHRGCVGGDLNTTTESAMPTF